MRHAMWLASLLILICAAAAAGSPGADDKFPSTYVPSGQVMYKEYCAVCYGDDAKGQGPFVSTLKMMPPNLTTLAKRHQGKFPYDYVSNIFRFGPGPTILHGSADMPTWGPIFRYFDKNSERAVEQRIKNLCNYLASLQEK